MRAAATCCNPRQVDIESVLQSVAAAAASLSGLPGSTARGYGHFDAQCNVLGRQDFPIDQDRPGETQFNHRRDSDEIQCVEIP